MERTLVVATEARKRERDALTHAAWGQRLDPAQFARREELLRGHRWALEAMTTWLLVDGEDRPLASCETFRMAASTADGAAGSAYGIASVFTEPALRGRGHARRMIDLVAERLAADDERALAAILFSEVGPTLYRLAGFTEVPWLERSIPAADVGPIPGLRLLSERGIREALAAIPRPADPFLVWPTEGQIDWHLERERAYAALLGRERPRAAGARAGDASVIWAADYRNERLCVLLGHAPDADAGGALLRAAGGVAARAGLASVHVWESASFPLPRGLGRIRSARDVPMLRPLAPGIGAAGWLSVPRALWV
ncbi:MAG TPA: N-acetyltransferase [Vulgatibacter sp.]|nr:N-acetyltransferase [Vulgatibacter sp.]